MMMVLMAYLLYGCVGQGQNDRKEQQIYVDSVLAQYKLQDSLKLIQDSLELKTFKNSIKIIKYYTSKPNSAGGVDCNVIWKNLSKKTVKYAKFTVIPYNAVNDFVKGKHDYGDGSHILGVTGPIKPNQTYGHEHHWECIWYNSTIDYMKIFGIEIEYTDGSKISTSNIDIIKKLGYVRPPNKF